MENREFESIKYINNHFAEDIDLKKLADIEHYNNTYYVEWFKAECSTIELPWNITWLRLTLPGGCPPSTISAQELNFCVRNGNRCILLAIITT